ncbi:sortase domain-bontaining protein [Alkalibacillus sp. S2W]|uniref:sortase domain-containing protein n=1 Tax=Alkalibacillus sp. S2W TaxID=3386553 RepID=UPI00398CFB9E
MKKLWVSMIIFLSFTMIIFVNPAYSSETTAYQGSSHESLTHDLPNKPAITLTAAKPEITYDIDEHSGEYRAKANINLYSEPHTSYKTNIKLSPNQVVNLVGKTEINDTTWIQISIHNETYWTRDAFLDQISPKQTNRTQETNQKTDHESKATQKENDSEQQKQSNNVTDKSSTSNENQSTSDQTEPEYQPMTIYFNGQAVSYRNGGRANGQSIINQQSVASTWGGIETFSGKDGMNTHFIGHNPGVFSSVWNAHSFTVTDANGEAFRYQVTSTYQVNRKGIGLNNGKDYWNRITGTSGGERITLQACFTSDGSINWIVEARLVE